MEAILLFKVLNLDVCERCVKYRDRIFGSAGNELKLFFVQKVSVVRCVLFSFFSRVFSLVPCGLWENVSVLSLDNFSHFPFCLAFPLLRFPLELQEESVSVLSLDNFSSCSLIVLHSCLVFCLG